MKRFIAIGNRIKALRGKKSQKDFSGEIGIPLRTYQNYETGERAPKGPALHKMAKKCNVSVDYILTGALSEAERAQMMRVTDMFLDAIKDLPEEVQLDLLKQAQDKKLLHDYQTKERRKLKDAR